MEIDSVKSLRLGFIGAGKVGTSLGKYLKDRGFAISGYCSRTFSSAEEAADFVGAIAYSNAAELAESSDAIFITVNDRNIKSVWDSLKSETDLKGKIVCHCSGALSSGVFDGAAELGVKAGSLHMLTAVGDKFESFKLLESSVFSAEGPAADVLKKIAESAGNRVEIIDAGVKTKYHAAAVMASNLAVGLVGLAAELLKECGFSEESAYPALTPLFMGNAENMARLGIPEALTGPVARGDLETVRGHIECFGDGETDILAKEVYTSLTKELLRLTGREFDLNNTGSEA